ncbi:MAG: hypothetical protein DWI17_01230 [Planctomycetota bacterium]|nr:MAG: hypothetical protein DWH74_02815 [Planctomycetota bacterium]RLS88699.1 MAG: hypothetical protein DWI09_06585 [Planctomycetota bacterium]RLS99697.1 MAG: hypothetical protein DWI17_01230 [Planctomycetota bacterium]
MPTFAAFDLLADFGDLADFVDFADFDAFADFDLPAFLAGDFVDFFTAPFEDFLEDFLADFSFFLLAIGECFLDVCVHGFFRPR